MLEHWDRAGGKLEEGREGEIIPALSQHHSHTIYQLMLLFESSICQGDNWLTKLRTVPSDSVKVVKA